MIFRNIRKTWIPAMYQGKVKMRGYFEGWYYKFADKNEKNIGALIPGVSFDKDGEDSHAFIQFLDDSGFLSHYFRYDIGDFSFSPHRPEIRIGDSLFSPSKIEININDNSNSIRGLLNFKGITPWPVSIFSPGAMGWYAFVPKMECYHAVLSFDHLIEGGLDLNGKKVDFSGGRGYMEKDWGRSFPSYHVWIQTNHFDRPGTSLMVSLANIPWLGKTFDGFLIGLWHDGLLYRLTTYTGARITTFRYAKGNLLMHVISKKYRLEIEVSASRGVELRSPVQGEMLGRLAESLSAETYIRLYRLNKGKDQLLFNGTGRHTGLEIAGKLPSALNR